MGKKLILPLLLIATFFISNDSLSQKSNQPHNIDVWKSVNGSLDQKRLFMNLANRCSENSPIFKNLTTKFRYCKVGIDLIGISEMKSLSGTVGIFEYDPNKNHKIHLNHIIQYPSLLKNKNSFSYRSGIPKWATSRCMVLAHELAEAYYNKARIKGNNIKGPVRFDKSHRYAIAIENKMREEIGIKNFRFENWEANEQVSVPHLNHYDFAIRIGIYNERIHIYNNKEAITIKVSYEEK